MIDFQITLSDGTLLESRSDCTPQQFLRKIQVAGFHDENSGIFYPPLMIHSVAIHGDIDDADVAPDVPSERRV